MLRSLFSGSKKSANKKYCSQATDLIIRPQKTIDYMEGNVGS